jgi:hypothetical protein
MLTSSKVETYKRFKGDIDGWARVSRKSEDDITEAEWTQLDQLVQRLTICKRGLGSKEYCQQTNDDLSVLAPDQIVRDAIMKLIPE